MNTARIATLVVLAFVAALFLSGCEAATDPDPEPEPDPQDFVNTDKPNGNTRIVSQVVLGTAGKRSSVYALGAVGADDHCVRGMYEGYYGAGLVESGGDVPWFYRSVYRTCQVVPLPPSGIVPNALVVVGSHDSNGDDWSDMGYVTLLSSTGDLLSQLIYAEDGSDYWFNSMWAVSDSLYVAVGGLATDAVRHALVVAFVLTPSGELEKRGQSIVADMPDLWFAYMTADPAQAAGPGWSFFVSSHAGSGARAIHQVTVDLPAMAATDAHSVSPSSRAPISVDWSREVVVADVPSIWINQLILFEDNLYFVGGADDPSKTPLPSGGGNWDSGLAGSVTVAGELRWVELVRLTGHSEILNSVVAGNGAVYAIGKSASFVRQEQTFGYGWIVTLAPDTGEPLSHLSVGRSSYGSGLNDGFLDGERLCCGGFTREETGAAFQAWICDVDVGATQAASEPAALRALEANDPPAAECAKPAARDEG